MTAGPLNPSHNRDVLIIGCFTSLQVYDPFENKDLFYKEIPDGVWSLLFGRISNIPDPLIFIGDHQI